MQIDRREFLRIGVIGGAAAALEACSNHSTSENPQNWPTRVIDDQKPLHLKEHDLKTTATGMHNLFVASNNREQWIWFFPTFDKWDQRSFSLVNTKNLTNIDNIRLAELQKDSIQTYPQEQTERLQLSEANALLDISSYYPDYRFQAGVFYGVPILKPSTEDPHILVVSSDRDVSIPMKFIYQKSPQTV